MQLLIGSIPVPGFLKEEEMIKKILITALEVALILLAVYAIVRVCNGITF